jgi:hypothetical protein
MTGLWFKVGDQGVHTDTGEGAGMEVEQLARLTSGACA